MHDLETFDLKTGTRFDVPAALVAKSPKPDATISETAESTPTGNQKETSP